MLSVMLFRAIKEVCKSSQRLVLESNLEVGGKCSYAVLVEQNLSYLIVQLQLLVTKLTQRSIKASCSKFEGMSTKKSALQDRIVHYVKDFLSEKLDVSKYDLEKLIADIPSKWQKHGDILLFPDVSFTNPFWSQLEQEFWEGLASILRVSRLGLMGKTQRNDFREPTVRLLLGTDGWTEHTDNGVKYCFDVTKTMFSSGNITEKIRVSKFDCQGEIVADLYAGIGYYSLPYLVHTKAAHVHACEWNPNAVEALRKGLERNKVADRCTVYCGDNSEAGLENLADRVNLGLLPTSRPGWEVACHALKKDGGILHIHDCLNSKSLGKEEARTMYQLETATTITEILSAVKPGIAWDTEVLHLERVKSYAPHIDHIVLDLRCFHKSPEVT